MVFGPTTHRLFARMPASSTDAFEVRDPWVTTRWHMPATVVSTTLDEPRDRPHATLVSGDAVDVVARLKEESAAAFALARQPVHEPGADGRPV